MLILQKGVGANDGRPHETTAERLCKGRGHKGENRQMHLFNAGEGLAVAGAKLNLGLADRLLGRRRCQLDGQANAGAVNALILVRVLKLGLVLKRIALLHTATARKGTVAQRDEGRQAVKQGIDKAVFVGQKRFLAEHVQKVRRCDLVTVNLADQVGVARQMLDRFLGHAARQLDGQYLLNVLDRNRRTADDDIKGRQGRLDPLYPLGINASSHGLAAKRCLGFGRADQHLRFPVILTLA